MKARAPSGRRDCAAAEPACCQERPDPGIVRALGAPARGSCRDERPVDPVPRRLRPCRQRLGGLPDAAARGRGLGGAHGAVLQPYRLRRLARPVFDGPAIEELVEGIAERGVLPSCDGCCRATWARPISAPRSCGGGAGAGGEPRGALLLRSGDRRYRPRGVRAPGHPGISCATTRCRRPTSSPRTSSSSTT